FNIHPTTGAVTFKVAPNFEAPTDSGANNIYNITVRANDGANNTDRAVAITVTNVNEFAPVVTSASSVDFVENGTGVAYTVTASDGDANTTFTYAIASGANGTLFNINPTTGALTFKNAPNYEDGINYGGAVSTTRYVNVTANDGVNTAAVKTVAINVTNALDNLSLGTYGQLIHGVNVDGKVYYVWDRNSDGVHDLNDQARFTDLDALFNRSNGGTGLPEGAGTAVGVVGDLDHVFRGHTFQLGGTTPWNFQLPTYGGPLAANGYDAASPGSYQLFPGTSVSGSANNPTYNDMLAIWDAFNGTGTLGDVDGTPPGWAVNGNYATATPWGTGRAEFGFNGSITQASESDWNYVVFEQLL
ncbi:MAG: hypothetical protein AB7S86_20210, partial [Hydrogenophaga sp.]